MRVYTDVNVHTARLILQYIRKPTMIQRTVLTAFKPIYDDEIRGNPCGLKFMDLILNKIGRHLMNLIVNINYSSKPH